jgi:hypothetical protein
MIIQSKETKGQTSLVDLLGGIVKNTEAKSGTPFAKLLTSLTGASASNDFNALIDPKNHAAKTDLPKELRTLLKTADTREIPAHSRTIDPKNHTAKTDAPRELRTLLQTPSAQTADTDTPTPKIDTARELRNILKSQTAKTADIPEIPAQSEMRKELRDLPKTTAVATADAKTATAREFRPLPQAPSAQTADTREIPARLRTADAGTPSARTDTSKELRNILKSQTTGTADIPEIPAPSKAPETKTEMRKEPRTLPKTTAVAAADVREAPVQPQSADTKTARALRPLPQTPKTSSAQTADIKELQRLLEGPEEKEDIHFISQELVEILPGDQVRTLIHQAKEYLKNEIGRQSPEYQNDPQSFPKTLIGLVRLADKLGLEPQSITLSSFVIESEGTATPELLSKPLLDARALAAFPPPAQERDAAEAITQLLGEIKAKKDKNLSAAEMPGSKETEQPLKTLLSQSLSAKADTEMSAPPKAEDRIPRNISLSAAQPLKTDIQNPANASEEKKSAEEKPSLPLPVQQTAKTEGLIALLQGESEPSEGSGGNQNSTAAEMEPAKALSMSAPDSLEVKAKEAQQGMRHFATDLKEAVENYKSPFTRLSMKLNPEKLGEVEVSLVQRGNNIHVNIQSGNASSVAFLAQNASELKAQLAHHGITNTTMNFMGGGEHQHSSQGQQQQGSHNPFRPYESLTELELNEEQLSALEIIIPHYA